MTRLNSLEEKIGYKFIQIALLERALTHRSAGAAHSERLEYLGDSVLDLAIARRLMAYEDLKEGDLTKIRSALVRESTLVSIAKDIGLEQYLNVGKNQLHVLSSAAVLADAVEAILGAIFLDRGFQAADAVIGKLYYEYLKDGPWNILIDFDPKTRLQELTQKIWHKTPVYTTVYASGPDHNKYFEVKVSAGSEELGVGWGSSLKQASEVAAKQALQSISREE